MLERTLDHTTRRPVTRGLTYRKPTITDLRPYRCTPSARDVGGGYQGLGRPSRGVPTRPRLHYKGDTVLNTTYRQDKR